ncbi:hypothetical protein Y032_0010g1081 [Ancylostoma ceylanicum]|uniref:Uncharacterized protein n=1 Tax=Ancylostoma ceylanicum TaxID=53326 RepID=A0A016VG83_9BILA|nr:hypothetical protein Y032_0010g1081 [Ancylostoma ceylanicum]
MLASVTSIQDLMMQAKTIRNDVVGLTEKRRHWPLNVTFDTGEELLLGVCDSRRAEVVGVLVNTNLAMNIDSFEQLTTQIGRLRLRRCGSMTAGLRRLRSNIQWEIKAFYMDLEMFYGKRHFA